jgi:pimeloyl-ACP methyl ester carboxylesterase
MILGAHHPAPWPWNSDPQGTDYSIVKEWQDLLAVAADTDATLLVGRSYGGLIAFETALLTDRLRKIAVYEPGVSIAARLERNWLPTRSRGSLAIDWNLMLCPSPESREWSAA